jgi:hypothetical protein
MDLVKVLAQLREELENLDAAIVSLERLNADGRRRGRPPRMPATVRKAGNLASERTGTDQRPAGSHKPL